MPRSDGTVLIDTKIDMSGLNRGTVDIGKQFGKIAASAKMLGATIASVFAVREIIQFGKESSAAARELSDAMVGLQSIVEGQGRSFGAAKTFIDEYISDGLVPATNAITAYKNLAMRGYGDMQIQQVMVALKDAAAFGRQASLSLGDAVQSATEGLKNENSVLVDNAGVTKNVAKMWEDYAKSIGTSVNNLTQQQKIQAEVTGILEETKYQTGDAARVTGTLSGQLMKLQFGFNNLKIAVGNAINPIIQTFIPVINTAISVLTRFANTVAAVIGALFGSSFAKITSTAENVSSGFSSATENAENLADATSGAGKAAQKSLASFDELNKLSDPNSGGGGGGGGGGSSVGDLTTEIVESAALEDKLSPQIDAVVKKIKELIKPLQDIDFSKARKSLKKLGDAFGELGKTIGKGLEWAWFNILIPLAEWAIEDAAPALIDLLAGAFDFLNEVIEAFAPIAEAFWDNFLAPLAEWTGDAAVDAIEWVAEGFQAAADAIEQNSDNLADNIIEDFNRAAEQGDANFIQPTRDDFANAAEYLSGKFKEASDDIIFNFDYAAQQNDANFIQPTRKDFENAASWISEKFVEARKSVNEAWHGLATWFNTNVKTPVKNKADEIGAAISKAFSTAWTSVSTAWKGAPSWFDSNVVTPIKTAFSTVWDSITGIFTGKTELSGLVDKVGGFFKDLANAIITGFNNALIRANSYVNQAIGKFKNFVIGGVKPFAAIQYSVAPQIPLLAKGAVIPPNAPFAAILGDQRHGTNIEAPLSTIQEAVAVVMEDMIQSNIAGHEATIAVLRQILEAVLGIEIGDSVIGEAAERYNRAMTRARGT